MIARSGPVAQKPRCTLGFLMQRARGRSGLSGHAPALPLFGRTACRHALRERGSGRSGAESGPQRVPERRVAG
jgi:hypothetical protein